MPTNPNDYALVIGINDYPSFRGLQGALEDAHDFAAWLTDKVTGGGVESGDGLKQPSKCRTVYSSPNPIRPIQDQIDDELEALLNLAKAAGGGRRCYLYFSGHGLSQNKFSTDLCLARWSESRRNLALDSQDYMKVILDSGQFTEVVFLMDCCRVRKVNAHGLPCTLGFPKPADDAGKARTFIANASEVFNPAFEAAVEVATGSPPVVRGHFTQALLEALWGGAAVPSGGVPASRLKEYLERETSRIAHDHEHEQRADVDNGLLAAREPIFGSAPPPDPGTLVIVTIRFRPDRTGEVVLEGPDLAEIRRGPANAGPWTLPLGPGQHVLTDKVTGEERSVKVRPGTEVLDVEF